MQELTPQAVENLMLACLPTGSSQEAIELVKNGNAIIVEGITNSYALMKDKLEENRGHIRELLAQLPYTFRVSVGGGWSFLNACNRQDGVQWTGMHLIMEQLFVLGMATEQVVLLLPREAWGGLPGGMPYYQINDASWGDIDVESEKAKYEVEKL